MLLVCGISFEAYTLKEVRNLIKQSYGAVFEHKYRDVLNGMLVDPHPVF